MKYISKTVWTLSLVSMFTDTASEMLYPVMPVYLKSIGFSIVLIGVLEGLAEATAGLSKGYFGKLSDSTGKRLPFVQIGYSLSALAKPLMALFVNPFWVFFVRTSDRLGKGIRTGARDAILSEEATVATKGKVFGFHRSMDTLGAVFGPLFALIYLSFYPENYRTLFYLALFPGLMAVLALFTMKSKKRTQKLPDKNVSFFSFLKYWRKSSDQYRKLVSGLLFFTLFNSSDVFLLLKAKESGMDDTSVIGLYIIFNLVYALFSYPLGVLADKIGLKKILTAGIFLFSIVYIGMSVVSSFSFCLFLFFLYGIYGAATEGISKAWISNVTAPQDTATAIGTFSAFQSVGTMLASSIAGLIWYKFGASSTFTVTAVASFAVTIYFLLFVSNKTDNVIIS